jgi:hypothetical protein
MVIRRIKQFVREPKMWLLLASPIITSLFSFLLFTGAFDQGSSQEE